LYLARGVAAEVVLHGTTADPGAEQISQAHDADQRVALDHGEVAKPAAEHELGRSFDVEISLRRPGIPGHPPRHGRARLVVAAT